jgi:hypothetical protein
VIGLREAGGLPGFSIAGPAPFENFAGMKKRSSLNAISMTIRLLVLAMKKSIEQC